MATEKGWWDSIVGAFSSGGGGGGGIWGTIAEGILGGISSRSDERSQQRMSREELDAARERTLISAEAGFRQARIQGDEGRRTIDFQQRLQEAQGRNAQARRAGGFRGFATGDSSGVAQEVEMPDYGSYYQEPTTPLFTPRKG